MQYPAIASWCQSPLAHIGRTQHRRENQIIDRAAYVLQSSKLRSSAHQQMWWWKVDIIECGRLIVDKCMLSVFILSFCTNIFHRLYGSLLYYARSGGCLWCGWFLVFIAELLELGSPFGGLLYFWDAFVATSKAWGRTLQLVNFDLGSSLDL